MAGEEGNHFGMLRGSERGILVCFVGDWFPSYREDLFWGIEKCGMVLLVSDGLYKKEENACLL